MEKLGSWRWCAGRIFRLQWQASWGAWLLECLARIWPWPPLLGQFWPSESWSCMMVLEPGQLASRRMIAIKTGSQRLLGCLSVCECLKSFRLNQLNPAWAKVGPINEENLRSTKALSPMWLPRAKSWEWDSNSTSPPGPLWPQENGTRAWNAPPVKESACQPVRFIS